MLKVVRRTREVDVILNQQTAEDIARLGDALAEETTREQVTEAGTNRQAKATARRIEELREQADAETLKLTLRALPVSKWAQALAAHRNDNGTNDMFGTAAAALPLMLDSATIGGKPVTAIGDLAFYRTKDKKSPHNAYTSGDRITASIEKLGYTQSYAPSYKGHYLFARDGREASLTERPGVMDAGTAKTGYIMNQAYFVYDPSDGLYHRYQYGGIHQGDEGPVAVKNVIFQYCQTGHYATTDYLDINVHTTECGYFMTDGKAIPINWEKDGEFGPTRYFDANHDEVVLNQGKTWVCIIPTRDFAKSEIIGNEDTQ